MKKKNEFGSIRQLASGRFQVRYMIDNQRMSARSIDGRSLTFESYEDARKYLLHLEADLERGLIPYADLAAHLRPKSIKLLDQNRITVISLFFVGWSNAPSVVRRINLLLI